MAGKFMNGKGAFLTLFVGDTKTAPLSAESWNVKRVAEEIADGVNGEDRERLDSETKHYELSVKCFNETVEKLKTLLGYDASLDNSNQPEVSFGLKLRDKAGKSDLFGMTECSIGSWEWASGGQTARSMLTIPIRARYFKAL